MSTISADCAVSTSSLKYNDNITLQRALAEVAEAYYVNGLDIDDAVVLNVADTSGVYDLITGAGDRAPLRAALIEARRLWIEATSFRRRRDASADFGGYIAIIGDDGWMPTSASIVAVDEFTGKAETVLRIYPSEEKVEPWGG